MNARSVSNRAGRRLGNTSIALMALTILPAFAQDSTNNGLRRLPFDINGTWSFKNGAKVWISQRDGDISISKAAGQQVLYRGRYESNPVITGREVVPGSPVDNPQWAEKNIEVTDPDNMVFGELPFYRVSNPAAHDLPCDEQNINHVRNYYAAMRGSMAIREQDYKTGTCWLTIGANLGYAPAQSMLAGLLVASKNPDYAAAFELATKSAKQGDMNGQKLLAKLYREGKGSPADPEQARLWDRRAADTQSVAMMKQALTPGNMLASISSFWDMFGGMIDLDLNMTAPNCYSRGILGNKPGGNCLQ